MPMSTTEVPATPDAATVLDEAFCKDFRGLRYLAWLFSCYLLAAADAFDIAWATALHTFFLCFPFMAKTAGTIALELTVPPRLAWAALVAAWQGAEPPEYVIWNSIIFTVWAALESLYLLVRGVWLVLRCCVVNFWNSKTTLLDDLVMIVLLLLDIAITVARLVCQMLAYLVVPTLLTFAICPCPYFTAQVLIFEALGLIIYGLLSP